MRRVLLLLCCLAHATGAHAIGGRLDLYGVDLRDDDTSLTVEQRFLLGGNSRTSADFSAGAGTETGLRLIAFDNEQPWIAGVDVSYFTSRNCCLEMHVGQLAIVGGIRLPQPLLARNGYGLHPYVLAGIASAALKGQANLGGIHTHFDNGPSLLENSDPFRSVFLAAGFDWQISKRLGVVAEYRWREFSFDAITSNSWVLPTENDLTRGRFEAGCPGIGISWLFGDASAKTAKMPESISGQPAP